MRLFLPTRTDTGGALRHNKERLFSRMWRQVASLETDEMARSSLSKSLMSHYGTPADVKSAEWRGNEGETIKDRVTNERCWDLSIVTGKWQFCHYLLRLYFKTWICFLWNTKDDVRLNFHAVCSCCKGIRINDAYLIFLCDIACKFYWYMNWFESLHKSILFSEN